MNTTTPSTKNAPIDSDWPAREAGAAEQDDGSEPAAGTATPPAHEDSALESIGKAITAPTREAADEDADEPVPSKPA